MRLRNGKAADTFLSYLNEEDDNIGYIFLLDSLSVMFLLSIILFPSLDLLGSTIYSLSNMLSDSFCSLPLSPQNLLQSYQYDHPPLDCLKRTARFRSLLSRIHQVLASGASLPISKNKGERNVSFWHELQRQLDLQPSAII